MNLHVHIYDDRVELDDNLIEEKDLEITGVYDEYIQFGFEHADQWIEIRVPQDHLK